MLESLVIQNFRALKDFEVPKLGRINLIVGKNDSGKSSVLEALRIYAGNANRELLETIAQEHDEPYRPEEDEADGNYPILPFKDFFSSRNFPENDANFIRIGRQKNANDILEIEHVFFIKTEKEITDTDGSVSTRVIRKVIKKSDIRDTDQEPGQAILIRKGSNLIASIDLDEPIRRRGSSYDNVVRMPCSYVPTQFIAMDELARIWDQVGLLEGGDIVRKALSIIAPDLENIQFVEKSKANRIIDKDPGPNQRSQRTAKVKLKGLDRTIPINSLGDGIQRILQLSLKLFPAQGGILLIDELENGLHFTVMKQVWELLFTMAKTLDIQIFATTHSWDCIEGFTQVAIEHEDTEGLLLRIGRSVRTSDHGRVIATVFDEQALATVTQQDMEVR